MLCHRCYLGANFWVNVFIFYYIGMVISISVLSFYSDGYYFSFHVVDILQSFGLLWWILVVPPFSHFGYLVINFFSQVKILFVFCFNRVNDNEGVIVFRVQGPPENKARLQAPYHNKLIIITIPEL